MRVLVVGAGYWGPNVVRNLADISDVEAIGVSDLDPKRAARIAARFPRTHVAAPAPEVFCESYDAAVIVTPVNTHALLATAALQAGMHVLVEKPLTRTAQEARDLIVLASATKRTLMAGHVFHYKPAVRELTRLVRSGSLGRVRYIDSIRVNLGLFRPDVNALWDLAPHDLTIFESLLTASPKRVSALGAFHVPHPTVRQESMVYLTMDYGEGLITHVHTNWFSPLKQRRMVIAGDKKMAVYDDIEYSEPIRVYDCGTYDPSSDTPSYPAIRGGDVHIPFIKQEEPLRLQLLEFFAAIREQRQPETDGAAGLRIVDILEAATRSLAQEGGFVDVPQVS